MPGQFEKKPVCRARGGGTPVHTKGQRGTSFCTVRLIPVITSRSHRVGGILALMACLSAPVLAQQDGGSSTENAAATTREREIQAERLEKAANLAPEELTPGEKHLTTFKDTAERLFQRHCPPANRRIAERLQLWHRAGTTVVKLD